jgi:hypothetical protein
VNGAVVNAAVADALGKPFAEPLAALG